jgi:uncharacterized protein YbjT (DUF2867 family)
MEHKNLLILGASGECGKWAVKISKERGYVVTVLVRSVASYEKFEGVKIFQGNALDKYTFEQVMKGQDAVVSCLGIRRKNPSNPWSALTSSPDFTKSSAENIVSAMNKFGVRRLVAISAAGVGDSWSKVNPITRLIIRLSNIAVTYRDLEAMEEVYRNSGTDSLVVRPVTLVSDGSNRAIILDRYKFTSQIAKRDVAEWMIDAIERPEPFINHSEMIGWA